MSQFFKVIVAGGRDFNNQAFLNKTLDALLADKTKDHEIIIVSGAAKGADTQGEVYARSKGYPLESHPADWDTYGRSAGYRRNKEMAESADALVCFWDGESRGSKHMIDLARDQGLLVRVIRYENEESFV